MKNYLIALVITAAMTASASTVQQMHRHTPRTTITDDGQTTDNNRKTAKKNTSEGNTDAATVKQGTTDTHDFTVKKSTKHSAKAKNSSRTTLTTDTDNTDGNNDGIEAYSDTSSTNFDSIYGQHQYSCQVNMDEDSLNHMMNGLSWISSGMVNTLLILLIIFVISPVAILIVLFYFIYKSRKQKLQLVEMAIKNGQPIPDMFNNKPYATSNDDILWRKGIKNVFVGIGLMFLFGFMDISTGIGIGFLVLFYGAGQAVIARTSQKRHDNPNDRNSVNDSDDFENF